MSKKVYDYDMNYVREQSSKELFKVISLFAGGGGSSTGDGDVYRSDVGFTQSSSGGGGGDASTTAHLAWLFGGG